MAGRYLRREEHAPIGLWVSGVGTSQLSTRRAILFVTRETRALSVSGKIKLLRVQYIAP